MNFVPPTTPVALGEFPGALILAVALSYLLGAVPFGLLLTRVLKGEDLRKVGSGNIGATNVMRALGRGWGLVSFALDCAKGWAAVALIAPGHLLLHGAGGGFPTAWARATYRWAGRPDRLTRFGKRQTRANLVEWITRM